MVEFQNSVVVEGILSEIDLELVPEIPGKSGKAIRGKLVMRVVQEVEKGKGEVALDVPVHYYVNQITKAGNINSSYTQLESILTSGKSIAAVGEDDADCFRLTGARIRMNEYYGRDGRLISFPRINGSFVNPIKRADMSMKAKFNCEVVIAKMANVLDKEGVEVEPQTLQILGVMIGYNDYTDILPFICRRQDIMSGIQAAYSEGDTITLSGALNFSSRTETYLEPVEIGDPIERQKTISVSEAVISGVAPRSLATEDHDPQEIQACLAGRTKRLEELKVKAETAASTPRETAKPSEQVKFDIGF